MSTEKIVFGIRIILDDYKSKVTQDTDIGLYNTESLMNADAAASQKNIVVVDSLVFDVGDSVWMRDDTNATGETGTIYSINYGTHTLTMVDNLADTYEVSENAIVTGPSKFRWIQNAVSGLTAAGGKQDWNDDMLLPDGIGSIMRSVDLRRHGNVAEPGGGVCRIINTGKFYDDMKTQGIYFPGKLIQVVYFTDTTETILHTYKCRTPSWNVSTFTIPYNNDSENRNANITTQVNVSGGDQVTIPATFGAFNDYKAKLVRSNSTETVYTLYRLISDINSSEGGVAVIEDDIEGTKRKQFPVVAVGTSPTLLYTIRIDDDTDYIAAVTTCDYVPTDLYVRVTVDTNTDSQVGAIRKVTKIERVASRELKLTVESYFPTELDASVTGAGSWVELVMVDYKYQLDTWRCKAFLDNDGTEIVATDDKLALFVYSSDRTVTVSGNAETAPVKEPPFEFIRMPEFGYVIEDTDENNMVDIVPQLFNNDFDTMLGYLFLPVTNVKYFDENNLLAYDINFAKRGIATYSNADIHPTVTTGGAASSVTDRKGDTYYNVNVTFGVAETAYFVYSFKAPEIPTGFKYDNVYLMTSLTVSYGNPLFDSPFELLVESRPFLRGSRVTHITKDMTGSNNKIDNMPDFYFLSNRTDKNNVYFYKDYDNQLSLSFETSGVRLTSGFSTFSLGIDQDSYDSRSEFILRIRDTDAGTNHSYQIYLYQLAFAFQKQLSIGDAIYTLVNGRTFGDTGADTTIWGGRKTAATLMQTPADIFESICRLQDWSEYGAPPTGGWGAAYSNFAKIKTTGDSNFDAVSLQRDNCSRQITSYDDAYTYALKKSLCRDFWFVNYVDNNGYECIESLNPTTTAPLEKITLADIMMAGGTIEITEQQDTDIFAEPFVRYQRNQATGKHEKIIAFKNTSAATYDASYVEAPADTLSGAEAETYWNRCKLLFRRAGTARKPPSDVTDLDWANGDNDGLIAKEYITSYIDWMFYKRVSFQVHFLCTAGGAGTTVRTWYEGKKFILQLVHETNNVEVVCVVESMEIETESPYRINIEAIMFSTADVPEDFYVNFVYDTQAQGADYDWTMDYTLKSNDNDKTLVY